jgi:hypothetical protein
VEWLSDNGPPFGSSFVKKLAYAFHVDIKFTPAYQPQSNGLVERFMGTLRRLLVTYINHQHINRYWDAQLRIFRFIYNTTHHSGTNNTPFYLVHGREARLPLLSGNILNIPSFSHTSYHGDDVQQYTDHLNDTINIAYDTIYEQHKNSHPEPTPNNYHVNDRILLFNSQLSNKQQNRHRKLMLDWVGPYTITNISSPSTVDIINPSTKKSFKNVHIKRIKPYST